MGGSSQKTDDATGGDVLDKTKNPPKPRVSTDVEDLVKKYSKQQSQELKKEFKKNQDELSKALTAQVTTSVSAAIQELVNIQVTRVIYTCLHQTWLKL